MNPRQERPALVRSLLLSCLLLCCARPAAAQSFQGGLRGSLRDPSGAVIAGGAIVLRNQSTNMAREALTNERGEYLFANLSPGQYAIDSEVKGFAPYRRTGVTIGVQQFIVLDITLALAGVSGHVTVTGEPPLIETANASVSASLDRGELTALPSVSRNPFLLATTTPNVLHTGAPELVRQQDQTNVALVSLGGGLRGANNYTLDGVPITDLRNRPVVVPSIEALEEVRIQVTTYDAEMGRTGGGVFNAIHRSGSNALHGSVLVQNRPSWGQGQLFFAKRAGEPKPDDNYYWLYAGSAGGALVRDRTFFWVSGEGYRTRTARNTVLTLPTAAMVAGDFRQTGRIIYDPLTTRPDPDHPGQYVRDPFPDNVIPPDRLNPVGVRIANYLLQRGSGNVSSTVGVEDRADQMSLNLAHRVTDRYYLRATYMRYGSSEPGPQFFGGPSDPENAVLSRSVDVLALNNTFLGSGNTVYTLRYGFSSFRDDDVPQDFDPAELGFAPSFLSQISRHKFPRMVVSGYGWGPSVTHGDRAPLDANYYSHSANATVSKLVGAHTLKAGADYRLIGSRTFYQGQTAGDFLFNSGFTQGPNPNDAAFGTGDPLASLLLGYPTAGSIAAGTPNDFFINYYAGFVQDDWRVNPSLVLNLGLRVEHETGLRERHNAFTVGFDRTRPFPVQVSGLDLRGGLMYAGVDGYPTHQGDPTLLKLGPRLGFAYSLGGRTVVRGGYGIYWTPHQYAAPDDKTMGTRGFTAITNYFASNDGGLTPAGTLTDPFPGGVAQPAGSAQGLLTGAGGDVEFVDQYRKSGYIQQYSLGVQFELAARTVVGVTYIGSRGDRLAVGGTTASRININQLDRSFLAMGTALQEQVANPFYGNPAFGNFSVNPTISRGQLLRPYPQFGNVYAHQVSEGRSRYHSLVLRAERALAGGWGARVNYTFSRSHDNIFGETNYFSDSYNVPLDSYDLDGEYGPSVTDAPHRLNVAGFFELPFGRGKRWLGQGGPLASVLGGWVLSVAGTYQSGFPTRLFQFPGNTGLFSDLQRPNVVPGVDRGTPGSLTDRVDQYLNPAAWTLAPPFTFGNAPRTDTTERTPHRHNWDIALEKSVPIARATLSVRAELINVFDHPDFQQPFIAVGFPQFGKLFAVGGFPRTLQFTTRFTW